MSVHMTEAKFLLRKVYYYIESQYLTHEVSTHPRGQASTAKGQNYIESKYLTHDITEAKYLLLGDRTTTLSPCISHNDVSTHHWDQGSTSRDQF